MHRSQRNGMTGCMVTGAWSDGDTSGHFLGGIWTPLDPTWTQVCWELPWIPWTFLELKLDMRLLRLSTLRFLHSWFNMKHWAWHGMNCKLVSTEGITYASSSSSENNPSTSPAVAKTSWGRSSMTTLADAVEGWPPDFSAPQANGHSAFQCPRAPQWRQWLRAIFWSNASRSLDLFPKPLPLPLPCLFFPFTGQNPLDFFFSINFDRASIYVVKASNISGVSCKNSWNSPSNVDTIKASASSWATQASMNSWSSSGSTSSELAWVK